MATTEITRFVCGPQCTDGTDSHVWNGPEVIFDNGRGGSVSCSRCGKLAIDVSLWMGDGLDERKPH